MHCNFFLNIYSQNLCPKRFLVQEHPARVETAQCIEKNCQPESGFTVFFCFDNSIQWFPIYPRIVWTSWCGSQAGAPFSLSPSPASPPSSPCGLAVQLPEGPHPPCLCALVQAVPRQYPPTLRVFLPLEEVQLAYPSSIPYPSQSQPDAASS